MTLHTIKQGAHYDDKLFSSWPWLLSPNIKRYVRFQNDCQYILPQYHQDNVNKLFGLQFGLKIDKNKLGKWDFGVHWNSARFGWRWSVSKQCIELIAYVYSNGIRNWDSQLRFPVVAQVKLDELIELEIVSTKDKHYFYSKKEHEERKVMVVNHDAHCQYFGITLSLMFGGELAAPHKMGVEMGINK